MAVAALVLLVLPFAQASSVSPLTPGTRVRVTATESGGTRTFVGPLRTFDGDALTLATTDSADRVTLPRRTITRIEVSRGQRGHAGRGALIGAVLGLAIVAGAELGCSGECEPPENYGVLVAGAIAGGGLVGAGVGAIVKSESWESLPWAVGPARRASVPLRGPWSMTLTAQRPGASGRRPVSLGLSLQF
jgi:hypothetical protein